MLFRLFLSCCIFLYSASSFAKEQSPAVIISNNLEYFSDKKLVIATGDVEIRQDGRILLANKVVYDQANNIVHARGNISLLESDGNVYFAEEIELTNDLKQGVVENFRARFFDDSMLAANKAVRENEDIIKLERAVYSPCKLCEKNPSKAPLWQIKAKKVEINREAEEVYYEDAILETYGIPVLYTPYFLHPTPGAQNKTGFLTPTYNHITTLGTTAKLPFFYKFSPNMDATIVPFLTSQEGPVFSGEFRHLVDSGFYRFAGSITNPTRRDEFGNVIPGEEEIRGHIEAHGEFQINENWDFGFAGKRSTDDTYLRRYKFSNEDKLTSSIYAEKIKDNNYIQIQGLSFQELNRDDDPGETPLVLPYIKAHIESDPGYNGSYFFLDTSSFALNRGEGQESRRLSVTGGWQTPYIEKNTGSLFNFTTKLRGDLYSVSDIQDPLNPGDKRDEEVGRIIPEAKLSWSLPLARHNRHSRIFIEPLADFIISPLGGNPDEIPNEDSQELELSDVNLFSANRFSGLDKLESGPRFNYGLKGGVFDNNQNNLSFLLGQSYRVNVDEEITNFGGFDGHFSDYVGRIKLSYQGMLDLTYRFRLNKTELTPKRNEVSAEINVKPIRLSLQYVDLDQEISVDNKNREEIFVASGIDLSSNWLLSGNVRRDLSADGGFISAGTNLVYHDECINIMTGVHREFLRDRDIEPSTAYVLQVSLKNLN